MKKYSIFERGMHWVILLFLILHIGIYNFRVYLAFGLNNTTEWSGSFFEVFLDSLMSYTPSFILLFIYILIFLLKRKTRKNISIMFSSLLFSLSFIDYVNVLPFLDSLLTIGSYLLYILFFINIFTTEKIELLPDEQLKQDILDYE